jgi:eukaryotic-like serine/threonine-protein kinase
MAALDRVIAGKPRAFAQRPSADVAELAIPPARRTRRWWWLAAVAALGAAGAVGWLVPAVRERVGLGPASASSAAAPVDPSGASTAKTVDELGAAEWTARLLAAPKAMDWKGGAKALGALAELDPKALRAAEVAKAATAVALGASRTPAADPLASEIFQLLAQRFGSEGLDLLYAMVEEQPLKHPAAARAATELGRPEVLARATPALRIAVELRDAPCSQKAAHFDGAAAEGDARVLRALKYLRGLPCRSEQDPCCFRANEALAKAIGLLEGRLKKE